jgi:hypothetical protein
MQTCQKIEEVLKPINGLVYGKIVHGTSTPGFGQPHFGFILRNVKDLINSLISKIFLYIQQLSIHAWSLLNNV